MLAACSSGGGGDEPGATSTSVAPTTTTSAVRCPDEQDLPDAAPVGDPVTLTVRDRGPDGRDGALDIGTLLPRSGDLGFLGAAALAGVELAVDDLDRAGGVLGAPVGVRHGDSAEGTPGTAEAEVDRLLGAGADVIVGPLASGTASRVLEQVSDAGALLVSPGAASSGLDEIDRRGRLFRTGPTEGLQGAALAELLRSDGHRTATVAARADDYGRAVADAFTARFQESGGSVLARADYDPSEPRVGQDVLARLDTTADAIVLVGLAETALILDALAEVDEGPRTRPVYGTDGNLGERLGDLLDDRGALACMRGVLPVDTPGEAFADRVRAHDPALADLDGAGLDLAVESYDATVVAALAAASAGTDDGEAVAAAMEQVTRAGAPCDGPADCLTAIVDGTDISYRGASGRIALDDAGNRTDAGLTVVTFDADGHIARLGTRRVRR